jgi:hypothetical protein
LELGEHPNVAAISITGRAVESYLPVLDAGTVLAAELLVCRGDRA